MFGRNPFGDCPAHHTEFPWKIFGANITAFDIVSLIVTIVLFLVVNTLVNRTKIGRSIRAVAQDARPRV